MNGETRRWLRIFPAAAACCLAAAVTAWGGDAAATYAPGELLVQTKAGVTKDKFEAVLGSLGAATAEEIPQISVKKIKVPPQAQEKVKAALARHPHVKYVENNRIVPPAAVPDDSSYASEWHLPKISAPLGWDISTGSCSIDIAIADSGVDPTHPDLAGKLLPGYNFVLGNTDTHDFYGHGTKVAGSAAAISNNGAGVTGVAWANPIVPLVVTDSSGSAYDSSLASAITYAADKGIRIINLSFGGPGSSITLQNAVDYAWNKGTIVFASAGNYGTNTPNYPAACNHVVAVSATDQNDAKASWSSYGTWVTVSAPGAGILTTANGGGYASVSGTSFSSPIAAGLGALILSVNPNLSNSQVVDIIKQNGDDLGTVGFDEYFGNGRINVYKSLVAASTAVPQTDTVAPTASMGSPASGSSVSGAVQVNVTAQDNVGVAKVDLYVDGALFATDTSAPYSFSWDTTAYADGSHDLYAVAYDAAGNTGTSSHSSVSVNNIPDTAPPQIAIITPASGSKVGSKATVKAAASDNKGVVKMELYIDSSLKTTVNSGSLSWSWNTNKAATGAHVIMTKAYDAAGNAGSASLTVYK